MDREKDIEGAEATEEASCELREREVRGFSSPCLLTATSCASGHVGRSKWSGTLLRGAAHGGRSVGLRGRHRLWGRSHVR